MEQTVSQYKFVWLFSCKEIKGRLTFLFKSSAYGMNISPISTTLHLLNTSENTTLIKNFTFKNCKHQNVEEKDFFKSFNNIKLNGKDLIEFSDEKKGVSIPTDHNDLKRFVANNLEIEITADIINFDDFPEVIEIESAKIKHKKYIKNESKDKKEYWEEIKSF